MAQRYNVVGGIPKKTWFYLNDETRVKGFRVYKVHDNKTGLEFWAADFQLRGKSGPRDLKEYTRRPLEDVKTRREAWMAARTLLEQVALPSPTKELHAL